MLTFGTIAQFAILMDRNAVKRNLNVILIPIVTIVIHAPRMFAYQNMVSAETFPFVTTITHALKILQHLLRMENLVLALILQSHARKTPPF
jgi:hypothetical protein